MSQMHQLLCFVGLHKWKQSRPLAATDCFPPSFAAYERPTRKCERCGIVHKWLPGYGGSEFGCWFPR